MNTRNLVIISGLFVVTCFSCKKNNSPSATSCNVLMNMTDGTDSFSYEYDNQDRLIKELKNGAPGASVVYSDGGNTIVETSPTAIITYTLNSNKQMISQVQANNDGSITKLYYVYDANNVVSRVIEQKYNVPTAIPDIDTTLVSNTVANGNIVESVFTNPDGTQIGVIRTSNDLTKLNNIPNARPYLASIDVYNGTSDKNLPITLQISFGNSGLSAVYTYEFDNKGRVTQQTQAITVNQQSGEAVNKYRYRCN